MRTEGSSPASTVPSTSVCRSEPARDQYSVDVCVKKILGTWPLARARSSIDPLAPVTGSTWWTELKGKKSDGYSPSS